MSNLCFVREAKGAENFQGLAMINLGTYVVKEEKEHTKRVKNMST